MRPTLTDADRATYPVHLLEGCETGLCLFAAAFLGLNDAAHFDEAGVVTTCIDTNVERLGQMSFNYPRSWSFQVADAWEFAEDARAAGRQWDAVSVDTFTNLVPRSLESLDLWCSLARRFVTVTITPRLTEAVPVPSGWTASARWPRSGNADWLLLERA